MGEVRKEAAKRDYVRDIQIIDRGIHAVNPPYHALDVMVWEVAGPAEL